ncbi:hypothetical protein AVU90_gp14 [Enterococcus phage IME-EFm5]|uniref:Uncharacterized protein n=1 Tax=Enterococcus phage IME-EFm5 TaxID=1718158 RepID=A0A0M3ULC6_9CAUD|nr:hypothetical protein AVU90_gp14 [Enterococcus phage IME-EFm5]ALF01983.1 hypothetical protein EFm5_14 [Enterococcus phage IME-EFm5]
MKLFIKSLFTLFYSLFIGVTLLYASTNGFFTALGNILIFILFGVSIKIMFDWVFKEDN